MQNPFPVHHSPHVCITFTCNWLDCTGLGLGLRLVVFWSRSHNRFLVSVSVSISVSHSLVSVLALVCSGLINKPGTNTRWCAVKKLFTLPHCDIARSPSRYLYWTKTKTRVYRVLSMARLCILSHVTSFVPVYFLVLVVSSLVSASAIDWMGRLLSDRLSVKRDITLTHALSHSPASNVVKRPRHVHRTFDSQRLPRGAKMTPTRIFCWPMISLSSL